MKTEKELLKRLDEINSDDILQRPCETTETNAPVALMQLALEVERTVLQWVLGINGKPKKNGG